MARRITRTTLPGAGSGPKKNNQNTRKRSRGNAVLDAYALAEEQFGEKPKIARHRLGNLDEDDGDDDRGYKRQRNTEHGQDDDDDSGNESGANEWWNGRVAPENDSEIDSDEAFGESDEERTGGYQLGSSKNKKKTTKKAVKKSRSASALDLDESSDDGSDEDEDVGDDGADLGDDAVDLATMLDDPGSDASDEVDDDSGSEEESELDEEAESDSDSEDGAFDSEDDDHADGNPLAELHDIIDSLHPKEKKSSNKADRGVSSLELGPTSELGVPTSRKLALDDVLGTITDKAMKKSLKSMVKKAKGSSGTGGVPGKLDAPLPKRKQDQLNRAAATKEAHETLGRWVDTVKHHRRAEHLSFPLVDPTAAGPQGEATFLPAGATKPMTELERTIQSILLESGLPAAAVKGEDESTLRAFDELEEKKMSVEEVMAARAALRQQRELLYREEVRAKRIKKIKSKSYRRVHRKEREREAEQEREALIAAGVDLSDEEREKNERRRAEERMGAKHRDSKWAKGMKQSGRTVWDDEAKAGVTEMARRNEELRRRMAGKTVHADESDLGSEFEDDNAGFDSSDDDETRQAAVNRKLDRIDELYVGVEEGSKSRLGSMKFMQRAEAERRSQNEAAMAEMRKMSHQRGDDDEGSDEGEDARTGRLRFGPKKDAPKKAEGVKRHEFEEAEEPGSDGDASDLAERRHRADKPAAAASTTTSTQKTTTSAASSNPWVDPTPSVSTKSKAKSKSTSKAGDEVSSDANPWTTMAAPKHRSSGVKESDVLVSNNLALPSGSAGELDARGEPSKTKSADASSGTASKVVARPGKAKSFQTRLAEPTARLAMHSASDDSDDSADSDDDSDGGDRRSSKVKAALSSALARNQALVQQAFGGADVEAEFDREKEAMVVEEDERVIDNTLPGWGSWAGAGVSRKTHKSKGTGNGKGGAGTKVNRFTTTIPGVKRQHRTDAKLKNVIVNERQARASNVYQSDAVPFPFTSREEYERSVRMPIGAEWSSVRSKPRVVVKPGSVIKPLRKPVV